MNNKVQRVAGKAVIQTSDGILILKPSGIDPNKKWHIPGGIRDDIEEPILATAIREVQEETKIILNNEHNVVLRIGEWSAKDKGEDVKILAIFFHFLLNKIPEIELSAEHDDFAWINKQNLGSYDVNKETIEIVHQLFP